MICAFRRFAENSVGIFSKSTENTDHLAKSNDKPPENANTIFSKSTESKDHQVAARNDNALDST
jgi:hypothetical protein